MQKRDQLFAVYSEIIGPIAIQIAAGLPVSFDAEDLEQIGGVALLEAASSVEAYLRERIEGAMLDSVRRRRYRDATHSPISYAPEAVDRSLSILSHLIAVELEEEARKLTKKLQDSVNLLPPDQAGAIAARFGGTRRGRPRKADLILEGKAIKGLREALLVRAA